MSDIMASASTYATGAIDTATTQVNDDLNPLKGEAAAVKINGMTTAIVQIETILGAGPDLKGPRTDFVERMAVEHNPDGTQKTLVVNRGGTGNVAFPQGSILAGDGGNDLTNTGSGQFGQVPISQSLSAPVWAWGLKFSGPSGTAASSTQLHQGTVVVAANQGMSGVHYFTDFTINPAVTVSIGAAGYRLVIFATGTITINGTIDGTGCGGPGGTHGAGNGGSGTDQPGGGGFGVGGSSSVVQNGITVSTSPGGNSGTQLSGSNATMAFEYAMGGAGGGGVEAANDFDGNGNGGPGGASIVLIAPRIVLGSASHLITNGQSGGTDGTSGAGGGGGGAGNIYMRCHTLTDNGCTYSMLGGSGGGALIAQGGNGASGVRQVLLFN